MKLITTQSRSCGAVLKTAPLSLRIETQQFIARQRPLELLSCSLVQKRREASVMWARPRRLPAARLDARRTWRISHLPLGRRWSPCCVAMRRLRVHPHPLHLSQHLHQLQTGGARHQWWCHRKA